jgi:hypothetical protein
MDSDEPSAKTNSFGFKTKKKKIVRRDQYMKTINFYSQRADSPQNGIQNSSIDLLEEEPKKYSNFLRRRVRNGSSGSQTI